MSTDLDAKIIRMANQIAQFMESKPHAEGVELTASHINDFWEPRMRTKLFRFLDQGNTEFRPLIYDAASKIKRPQTA